MLQLQICRACLRTSAPQLGYVLPLYRPRWYQKSAGMMSKILLSCITSSIRASSTLATALALTGNLNINLPTHLFCLDDAMPYAC
eukprot:4064281-Amphidinium_carterae.1